MGKGCGIEYDEGDLFIAGAMDAINQFMLCIALCERQVMPGTLCEMV
jgi:hypothetical protein